MHTDIQDQAFTKIKQLLTSGTVMAYFDQRKETELITDALPYGFSAILFQKTHRKGRQKSSGLWKQISFRYRELILAPAIVWAVEQLHLYIFLEGTSRSTLTASQSSWFSTMWEQNDQHGSSSGISDYFVVVHTKGSRNPSDFLSKHPSGDSRKQEIMTEEYVNFIANYAIPKAMILSEIQETTNFDKTFQFLAEVVRKNQWKALSRKTRAVTVMKDPVCST